jgi:serine/threonine-protein kinase
VLHFEQAVALDSSFALAWSGLADALDALAWRTPDARGRVPEAKRAAQIAVSLDPLLAEGWASLGVLASDFDHDWKLAELALRRAIQLKPSYAEAQLWLGAMYRVSGRTGQAVEPFRAAIELDPLARLSMWSYAHTLVEMGDSAEALQLFLRLHSHHPSSESALQLVLYATMFGFDQEEAATYAREWAATAQYDAPEEAQVVGRALFNATLRRDARRTLERIEATGVEVTRLLAAIGEFEAAFDRLERMAATGDPTTVEFLADPVFRPVRGHPRFLRLREHVQLERNFDPESTTSVT